MAASSERRTKSALRTAASSARRGTTSIQSWPISSVERGPDRTRCGGSVTVVRIRRGVVVGEPHRQPRAPREEHRRSIAIPVLPAKVPLANPQQILLRTVGKRRRSAHLLPEVVRVRIDAHRLDVDREHVAVLHDVVRLAGGNVDRLRLELHADRRARRRRVGEEQADRRLHRFARGARDHVEQQDQVGAGIERPRVVGRLHHRHLARRPAVHVLHLTAVHRRETGTRLGTIERARHAPEIDRHVRVVQHLRAIGAELDGAHVARRGDRHRNDEVAEHVAGSPGCSTYASGSVSTRSGVPSCHPPENVGGFGASAGFPSGAPLSTHFAMSAI